MTEWQRGQPPHLADARDLEAWADRVEARTDFPRLIRRLISQTNDQVVVLEMRAGEGAGYSGYDGQVEASRGTPFVPEGRSVWELGVGKSPGSKANDDYEKRTNDPLGIKPDETTFVFATARRWPGKVKWQQEKQAEGKWRDVRAFDADDIEAALESAPAAHYWLSEIVGKPASGVRTIEDWWARFASTTTPPLTERLVLAGRTNQASELLRVLDQDSRITSISAASTDDVLAFVAGTLISASESQRADLLAKTLIVRDPAALQLLDVSADLLVILPYEDELRREAQLIRSHHVLLLAPTEVPGDIVLPPVDRDVFAAELEKAGVSADGARKLAGSAHRSVVAFHREAAAYGAGLRDWGTAMRSKIVRRAWLAAAWHEGRSGDTDALTALFGAQYEDARSELEPHATGEDPLFATVGGAWSLTSPEEAWQYGIGQVSRLDLDAVEVMAQTVLGAIDPALELPLTDRWAAGLYGKTRIHSSDLRTGLATTLGLAGTSGAERRIDAAGTVADWATRVVAHLLRRANEDASGQLWASLTDALPLLAEAAPDVFLYAVEEGVSGDAPVLATIFTDQESSYTVSSPHTGLLWALERVAWSPDHAALSARLLTRLAEIDPGGRLANRPLASLVSFFRPWLPQTSLDAERRLKVLDGLRRDHEAQSWQLMSRLLPEPNAIGSYSNAPAFRAWKSEREGVSGKEFWDFSSQVAQRLIEAADADADRWSELVERLEDLSPPEREQALARLAELTGSGDLQGAARQELWTNVDTTVRKHRAFTDAPWALPEKDVERLAAIAGKLLPDDPIQANRWLFDEHLPDLGGPRANYEVRSQQVETARSSGVRQVLDGPGVDGILELARLVKYPGMLGYSTDTRATGELDARVIPLLDDDDQALATFASGYAFARVQTDGWSWLDEQLGTAADLPIVQARLLLQSTDLTHAWQTVGELGTEVEAAYWKEFSVMGRGPDFELVEAAARKLMEHNRPLAAVDLMAMYADPEKRLLSVDSVLEGLDQLLHLSPEHQESQRISEYELDRLMVYARAANADEDRLAQLEWGLLPARGYQAQSPTLHRRLARDPAFFVEIVSLIYKPAGAESADEMSPELAANAYRLMSDWRIIPGSTEPGGEVDEEKLRKWLEDAEQLLSKADRRDVGEIHVGQVFAHARPDEDGTWPTSPVRNAIESAASPRIEQGLATQTRNNRGVTSRDALAGGEQERQLARHYDELAARIRDEWPRTAGVLSSIARSYENEAHWHDEESERFRQGLDR